MVACFATLLESVILERAGGSGETFSWTEFGYHLAQGGWDI